MSVAVVVAACAPPPRGIDTTPERAPTDAARIANYEVQPGDDWGRVSEIFFGHADRALRIALDNGGGVAVPPSAGRRLEIRITKSELDVVRAIAEARGPYNVGVEAMGRGENQEASEAFEEALRKAPWMLDARYNLGLVCLRLGEPETARRNLEAVVTGRPNDADAHYALGASWFHAGAFDRALPPLARALELQPGHLRARYSRALSLARVGRNDEARDAFLTYLELDPRSAWAEEARVQLQNLPPGGPGS